MEAEGISCAASDPQAQFARSLFQQVFLMGRGAAAGADIDQVVQTFARSQEEVLVELLRQKMEGRLSAGDLATAKQVISGAVAYLLSLPIPKHSPHISGAAQVALDALNLKCCTYEDLPHPRFRITQDWFSGNAVEWERVLVDFRGRPAVNCLEIGSFEGLSACWMLEHVLTHETSRITCIDPFDAAGHRRIEAYFDHNIQATGSAHKVQKLKGRSRDVLPFLSGNTYGIIYVDGSHLPQDVLDDALQSWPLLSEGGLMIFDDYEFGRLFPAELASVLDPKLGIDAFLAFISGQFEPVAQGWQLVIRKVPRSAGS